MTDRIQIEVAYATPEEQLILELEVASDCTIKDALLQSKITEHFPEIDLESVRVGIFSKPAKMDAGLQPGDRIEIYRKLIADPKESRKKRAAEGKVMKKGAKAKNAEA